MLDGMQNPINAKRFGLWVVILKSFKLNVYFIEIYQKKKNKNFYKIFQN